MIIEYSNRFKSEFFEIYKYIARDSYSAADRFKERIYLATKGLPNFPYKCRKSTKFNDKNIRDLVFERYVMPYFIEENRIIILGIFKENKWDK